MNLTMLPPAPQHMESEEFSEPPPPSPEKAAKRALILSAISCRGIVDRDCGKGNGSDGLAKQAHDWLRDVGLEGELTHWERQVLNSPPGSLTDRDRINASWLSEAVVVLAWSLGKTELPKFDEECDPADAANSLGFFQPRQSTVLNTPQLRSPADLQEYNNFIHHLHWRVRDFSLNKRPYNFESLARKAWGEPVLRHGLVLKDADLCVDGVPLSQASENVWRPLASIIQERHRASNWLIGYASEDFYEVTTDT